MKLKIFLTLLFSVLLLLGALSFLQYTEENVNTTLLQVRKLLNVSKIYDELRLYTGMPTVPLVVQNSDILNAWTDGTNVTITTRMIDFLDNDDEIATVLGHEMAHVLLKHKEVMSVEPPILSPVNIEAQADKMGAFITLRAGYDICKGRQMWIKLANYKDGDYADPLNYNHPSYAYRYETLSMPWCYN